MQFHNQKTNVTFKTRTKKENNGRFISIVERLELGANNIVARAYLSSREVHATRAKARHYATSMARYQFSKHCAIHGM
jgi:hypothetical protein